MSAPGSFAAALAGAAGSAEASAGRCVRLNPPRPEGDALARRRDGSAGGGRAARIARREARAQFT
jgi:hypothetical protein